MKISSQYISALSEQKRKALSFCTNLADDMDIKIYLVGGIVRDILLGREFNDIDILIEYDAIVFAELLQKKHSNNITILAKNEKFKTVKLRFDINSKTFEADIASTRSEVYEYPSALPILADTCVPLSKDIKRRDFTINSLVMSLNQKDFCEIYDETEQGLDDLNSKLIRILHPDSFMDDPSRIVRGLKYRTKLDFYLAENTKLLQENCLQSGKFDNDCQERIKKEVIETLNLLEPSCFDKFISENIYKLIINDVNKKNVPSGILVCEVIQNNIQYFDKNNIWLIFLAVIFNFAPSELADTCIDKLNLTKKEQRIMSDFIYLQNNIGILSELEENYDIYKFFKNFSNEAIIAAQCVLKNLDNIEKIYLYFNKLKDITLTVSGKDIQNHGIDNGIIYKQILEETLKAKINKNLSAEEEKKYLKSVIKMFENENSKVF